MSKKEPMKEGSYNPDDVVVELPTGRQIYDWKAILEAIQKRQVYVLPEWAKKNSILTGMRREKIPARLGNVRGSEQLVLVPT